MGEARRRKLASQHLAALPESRLVTLPARVLDDSGSRFPGVWKRVDAARVCPEQMLMRWPGFRWKPWCFLPANIVTGIVAQMVEDPNGDMVETEMTHACRLITATAAWRMTKGVYVFDPTVLAALLDSEVNDELPEELLLQMPEWCPYIATPGFDFLPRARLHGFFAYVDDRSWPGRSHPQELNFELILDPRESDERNIAVAALCDDELRSKLDPSGDTFAQAVALGREREYLHMHVKLPLGRGSFTKAISEQPSMEALRAKHGSSDLQVHKQLLAQHAQSAARLASLLLYLVSEKADVPAGTADMRNRVTANEGRGSRNYQAPTVQPFDVGFRIGAQIRAAQAQRGESHAIGSGESPCPHIRRAHWHTFWAGPRSDPETRVKKLHWLPPILVNVGDVDDLVPTVHQDRR